MSFVGSHRSAMRFAMTEAKLVPVGMHSTMSTQASEFIRVKPI